MNVNEIIDIIKKSKKLVTKKIRPSTNIIKNLTREKSSYEIIAFLILGVLNGSLSAFIISKYKNYNLIASMFLPTLLTLFVLYLYLFLPIFLGETNMIDYGLTTFCLLSIINLYMFLRDA